jgi:integrase
MTDPALTFHSFRHSFTAELRRLKCNVSIMKELLGHAQTDVTSGYGRTEGFLHELGDLNEAIQHIAFPGLDLGHLADLRPWLAR